jgi:hypothetical protein
MKEYVERCRATASPSPRLTMSCKTPLQNTVKCVNYGVIYMAHCVINTVKENT